MLSLERQRIGHEGIRRVHEALETKGYKGAAQKRSAGAEARAEARKLGKLLVREFGAKKVYLLGSLTRDGVFHERSDIDLAADGIVPERFFKAGVALARSYDYRYQVELVDLETVSEGMRELILAEGVLLNDWTGSASAH